jgi:hypothetical protein
MTTSSQYTVNLIEDNLQDPVARKNFSRIKIFLRDAPLLKAGFVFKEIQVGAAGVPLEFKHNLKFVPKDLIITSVIPSTAVVSFVYENFDDMFIRYSATAPCTIRCFVGTYGDGEV